ncbi:MAG: GNAT family N-acetyltransferase, partial [Phycisphaerae bacterium]|nr:GNAT family N-acetyltransferase [Phycisphaerae bacterium]
MGQKITGPNTPSPHQLADVVALANRAFRTTRAGDMGSEYPLLFGIERLQRLRIFQVDGWAVAMVGMILNDTVLLGCDVRVACVGSVCTDRAHRASGLAGRLMDDAVQRARAAGASIMLISGDRSLYARRGAFAEGRFHQYTPHPAALGRGGPEVQVKQIDPPSCALALRMSQAEPIHFRRTRTEYAAQIASGFTQDRPGATYEARREPDGRRADIAVLSVSCPGPPIDDERIV